MCQHLFGMIVKGPISHLHNISSNLISLSSLNIITMKNNISNSKEKKKGDNI